MTKTKHHPTMDPDTYQNLRYLNLNTSRKQRVKLTGLSEHTIRNLEKVQGPGESYYISTLAAINHAYVRASTRKNRAKARLSVHERGDRSEDEAEAQRQEAEEAKGAPEDEMERLKAERKRNGETISRLIHEKVELQKKIISQPIGVQVIQSCSGCGKPLFRMTLTSDETWLIVNAYCPEGCK